MQWLAGKGCLLDRPTSKQDLHSHCIAKWMVTCNVQVRDEYSTANDVYVPKAAQTGPGGTAAAPTSGTAAAASSSGAPLAVQQCLLSKWFWSL